WVLSNALNELYRPRELSDPRQVATGIDGHTVLLITPQADGVKVLQRKPRWVEECMTARAARILTMCSVPLSACIAGVRLGRFDFCQQVFRWQGNIDAQDVAQEISATANRIGGIGYGSSSQHAALGE